MTVRAFCPADTHAYRAVRLTALQESPPAFGSLPENEPDLSATSTRLQSDDHHCFFGAFDGERLIGIIRVSRSTARDENHRADLGGLYILPSHRQIGCGKALVRAALTWATNTPGVRRANLTVVTQ